MSKNPISDKADILIPICLTPWSISWLVLDHWGARVFFMGLFNANCITVLFSSDSLSPPHNHITTTLEHLACKVVLLLFESPDGSAWTDCVSETWSGYVQILTQEVCGGAGDPAFSTSAQCCCCWWSKDHTQSWQGQLLSIQQKRCPAHTRLQRLKGFHKLHCKVVISDGMF